MGKYDNNTINADQYGRESVLCGPSTLAWVLDLDESGVRRLVKEGIVKRVARGTYDLLGSARGYIAYQRANMPSPGKVILDFAEERARLVSAKANLAEMEEQQRRRELILAQDAYDTAFELAREAQEALIAIPDRLASVVAAESDAVKVHKLMEEEIRHVCEALAGGAQKMAEEGAE